MTEPDRLETAVADALVAGFWLAGHASSDELLACSVFADRGGDPLAELATLRRLGSTHAWVAGGRTGRPDALAGTDAVIAFSATPPGASVREVAPVVALLHPTAGLAEPPSGADTLALLSGALTAGQAHRELLNLLGEATVLLEQLGLQRQRADLAAAIARQAPAVRLPGQLDSRLSAALERAMTVRSIVRVALDDDGAAVTAVEAAQRSRPLRELGVRAGDVMAAAANGLNLA